ncbi:MAG: hypothetical protein ACRERC_06820 [Candidatus Binatia bacterium]
MGDHADATLEPRIALLAEYRSALDRWFHGEHSKDTRSYLNRNLVAVRQAVIAAGAGRRMTISPPPAVGGIVAQAIDPFENLFISFWGISVIPTAIDAIDQAIGVYEHIHNGTGLVRLQSREAIDIESAIERALRPSFRRGPPTSERDVQDAVEDILIALGVESVRDKEVVQVGAKAFKPDFTVPDLELAIEVKLASATHSPAAVQEELSADTAAYLTHWTHALFVIYDLGAITDPVRLRRDNQRKLGVSVLVVKH